MRRSAVLKLLVLAVLFLGPACLYIGFGFLWLWHRGWAVWAAIAWVATSIPAAVLADRWTRREGGVPPPIDWNAPETHDDRDKAAWGLVQTEAARGDSLSYEDLARAETYFESGLGLAQRLAAHYQPAARGPIEQPPIADLLTAIELAAEDLGRLCRKAPGGEMISIGHVRTAVRAAEWLQRANEAYAHLMPLAQPITGLMRLGARQFISNPAWKNTGRNMFVWFYNAYINKLGIHLIELYSGRLAAGAGAYRMLRAEPPPQGSAPVAADRTVERPRVVALCERSSRPRELIKALEALEPALDPDRLEGREFPESGRLDRPTDPDLIVAWTTPGRVSLLAELLENRRSAALTRENGAGPPRLLVVLDGVAAEEAAAIKATAQTGPHAPADPPVFVETRGGDDPTTIARVRGGLAEVLPAARRRALLRSLREQSAGKGWRKIINRFTRPRR